MISINSWLSLSPYPRFFFRRYFLRRIFIDMNISFNTLQELSGFIAAAVVDSSSGMMLDSTVVGDFDIDLATAGNTEVLQAKLRTMQALGLGEDGIEDILITLGSQYHIIRPLSGNKEIFIYISLDRSKANLAMARIMVKKMDESIGTF